MKRGATDQARFHFVTGVSITAFEEALNAAPHELELRQVIYAAGTGFVAILEHVDHGGHKSAEKPEKASPGRRNER